MGKVRLFWSFEEMLSECHLCRTSPSTRILMAAIEPGLCFVCHFKRQVMALKASGATLLSLLSHGLLMCLYA